MSSTTLPKTHRAIVLSSKEAGPKVESVPFPSCPPGSAIIRIAFAAVLPYAHAVYTGARPGYPMPMPLVIGSSAVGHVATLSADATTLQVGQLVLIDSYIRGRDNANAGFLMGLHEGFVNGSSKLMAGEWRDATYAEYAKVPLENCHVLDEKRLLSPTTAGGLGYQMTDLCYMARQLVPFGGLADIDLQVGETVIIAPATGSFGGTAVQVALAMGARVIACGRNAEALKHLEGLSEQLVTVQITGDVQADTAAMMKFGPIDAFQDWSPPWAGNATHIKSCIAALRIGGRVSLMGGVRDEVSLDYGRVMYYCLTIKGKWMYSREHIPRLIKMVERGILKVGETGGGKLHGTFKLEEWEKAFKTSEEHSAFGDYVLIAP